MATNPDEAERKGKQSSRVRSLLRIALIPVGVVVAGAVILLLVSSVGHTAEWTGLKDFTDPTGQYHRGKTLWDWAELLIIPVVLGIGLWWLNRSERRRELRIADQRAETERRIATERAETERQIAADRLREEALQAYLDRMTELILEKGLRQSEGGSEVRAVARTRTLTVLRSLDATRTGAVLRFLYEAELIGLYESWYEYEHEDAQFKEKAVAPVLELYGADLSGANLMRAKLNGANLSEADLSEADLSRAKLSRANLMGAKLDQADLRWADLRGAEVTAEQLEQTKSLEGATMPDGTKHD